MEGMKHFGWGILDKNGDPFIDDSGVDVCERVYELNSDPESTFSPYRVVELFYKDEQS